MTTKQILTELQFDENLAVDFFPGFDVDLVGRSIGSFLNSGGGVVVCGVGDDGAVLGVSGAQGAAEKAEEVLSGFVVPRVLFSVDVQEVDGLDVVVVEIPAGKDVPYAFKDGFYIREDGKAQRAGVETVRGVVCCEIRACDKRRGCFVRGKCRAEISAGSCSRRRFSDR